MNTRTHDPQGCDVPLHLPTDHPMLQTQIWSLELGTLKLHPVDIIQCHFAHSTMQWEGKKVMVTVSLSRVHSHFILLLLALIIALNR